MPEQVKLLAWNGTGWYPLMIDEMTRVLQTLDLPHAKAHEGDRYFRLYSVPSLGDMASPADMITLTWTTPDTLKWEHFSFGASGTGGWRLRLIEAPTGGAASATGVLPMLNRQRNSSNTAGSIDLASGVGNVSYDATLATGGITLWDEYIKGDFKSSGNIGGEREEIIMKQNTKYQLSLYGTDTDPGTLLIDYYEHTNKGA